MTVSPLSTARCWCVFMAKCALNHLCYCPYYFFSNSSNLVLHQQWCPCHSDSWCFIIIKHITKVKRLAAIFSIFALKKPPYWKNNYATSTVRINKFSFNNQHFLQVQGTAMWIRMAPWYANLFMGKLERFSIENVPFKPYVRCSYDIFKIGTEEEENLKNFLHDLLLLKLLKYYLTESNRNASFYLERLSRTFRLAWRGMSPWSVFEAALIQTPNFHVPNLMHKLLQHIL